MESHSQAATPLTAERFWARAGDDTILRGFSHCCVGRLQAPRTVRAIEATDVADPRLTLRGSTPDAELTGTHRLLLEVETAVDTPTELVLVVLSAEGEFIEGWVNWEFRANAQEVLRSILNLRLPDFSHSTSSLRPEAETLGRKNYLAAQHIVRCLTLQPEEDACSQRAATLLSHAIENLRQRQTADAQAQLVERQQAPIPPPPARYPGPIRPYRLRS